MKLGTDLQPRLGGEINATTAAGKEYIFMPDASGALVAEVTDEEDIGFLLDTGNFYPADEKDISAGLAAVKVEQIDEVGDVKVDAPVAEVVAPAAKVGKAKK